MVAKRVPQHVLFIFNSCPKLSLDIRHTKCPFDSPRYSVSYSDPLQIPSTSILLLGLRLQRETCRKPCIIAPISIYTRQHAWLSEMRSWAERL